MKRRTVVLGLPLWGIALCLFALCGDALAREGGERKKKPTKPRVFGLVATEKEDDEITKVTLTAKRKDQETVYNVTLDEKGKQLGKEMDGKRVIATGTIEEKDDGKWLTVEEYREATVKKKKPKEGGEE